MSRTSLHAGSLAAAGLALFYAAEPGGASVELRITGLPAEAVATWAGP